MRWIVPVAAAEAAATGLVLIISPPLFAWLVFDAEFSEAAQALGRLAGIALVGFALASWPVPATAHPPSSTVCALLVHNVLTTIYLCYLGAAGKLVGLLLWPAAAMHAGLAALLARGWLVRKTG